MYSSDSEVFKPVALTSYEHLKVRLLCSNTTKTSSMHNMVGASVSEVYNIIWCQFDLKIDNFLIGASLSEPHTSVTALRTCVCMFACLLACLLAAIYRKFLMSTVKF